MKNYIKGVCCICGENKTLTFEHVPPKSAFNNKPIYFQRFEHLHDKTSFVYGKKSKSNKGFGDYTLCKKCNNNTGDWYARDFAEFAFQGMNILRSERKTGQIITFDLSIKPLNVLKEIIAMFMSADKTGSLRGIAGMKEFILNKSSKDLPKSIDIYMYCSLSYKKKFIGYSIMGQYPSTIINQLSEINFEPYGYVLTIDSQPPRNDMKKITTFKNSTYNLNEKVVLELPYLKVEHPIIGIYAK